MHGNTMTIIIIYYKTTVRNVSGATRSSDRQNVFVLIRSFTYIRLLDMGDEFFYWYHCTIVCIPSNFSHTFSYHWSQNSVTYVKRFKLIL